MKFEYQIWKTSISFLDTDEYIKNNKLCTKLYRKATDCQTFLNINSEHLKSLKASIPYSQALRIKRICSKATYFEHTCKNLKEDSQIKVTTKNLFINNSQKSKPEMNF